MMTATIKPNSCPLADLIGTEIGDVVASWSIDGVAWLAVVFGEYGAEVQLPADMFEVIE